MTYCIINGYTRQYYKTINVAEKTQTFVQPTLTANGTLGGNTFAVSASSENQSSSLPYRAYEAFDNNSATYWRCTNTTSGWIQFYNPKPLYVTSLTWGYFHSYPTGGSVQASNDGNTWTTLKTWTNSSASDFVIDVNSNTAYKYHRISVTGVNNDVVHCAQLTITATELLEEAYSYETDGTEEDYDRYVDFPNLFSIVNGYTRQYYKAKRLLTEQFNYEIEGIADDYDRYEDVLNILGVEMK